jgi:hypothetical protein
MARSAGAGDPNAVAHAQRAGLKLGRVDEFSTDDVFGIPWLNQA